MDQQTQKYQRLTYEERVLIEDRLNHGFSIKSIARFLNRSPSSISREIKKHSVIVKKATACIHVNDCEIKNLCTDCRFKGNGICKRCPDCHKKCTLFSPMLCPIKESSPYVCNTCSKKAYCHMGVTLYKAKIADKEAAATSSLSRSGFNLTLEDLERIEDIVVPLIRQGQSPYHILLTHKAALGISEATLRRLIDRSELTARNIDLRRQVKLKPRKKKSAPEELLRFKRAKEGHTWEDFLKYMQQNPDLHHVEMDCVEGAKEDHAVLLTLHIKYLHLQLAFILEDHTLSCVVDALDRLEFSLGKELFKEMFPVILTDNGHEFADRLLLEHSISGGKRTIVYYCEPNKSNEKGSCERNHELIRFVIPKGSTLEPYSQSDISLMMNHINSYRRRSIGNRSPYELAKFYGINEDFFTLLGLEEISPDKIELTPKLFRYKKMERQS